MIAHRINQTTIVAVVIATTAALFARDILRRQLANSGYETSFAADLSYLVVPPILAVFLFPIWRVENHYILAQFRRMDISWNVVLRAVAIGTLMRIAWWSQLIAGISLGFYRAADSAPIIPLAFSFQCPPVLVISLGFFVMTLLVPLVEEVVHRGYIQGILHRRGVVLSVIVSTIVFTVFHRYSSWPFALFAGLVFGTQYWIAGSLWPSIISHATFNSLIQVDWRCLTGQWNPMPETVPIILPGIIASTCLLASVVALSFLIRGMAIGAGKAPR